MKKSTIAFIILFVSSFLPGLSFGAEVDMIISVSKNKIHDPRDVGFLSCYFMEQDKNNQKILNEFTVYNQLDRNGDFYSTPTFKLPVKGNKAGIFKAACYIKSKQGNYNNGTCDIKGVGLSSQRKIFCE